MKISEYFNNRFLFFYFAFINLIIKKIKKPNMIIKDTGKNQIGKGFAIAEFTVK
jgi:hypothetical protein